MDQTLVLGKKAKDKITGFEGILVSRIIFLFGCEQWGIAGQSFDEKEAKRAPTEYFDDGRIEITGPGIAAEEVTGKIPGPDFNADRPKA